MLKGIHQQLDPQASPAFFVQGPKPFSRLMLFVTVSMVMMGVDARFDYLNQIRQGISTVLHPLEMLASAPDEWGRNIDRYFTSHNKLIQENFALKQQALIDHAALQRLATVDAENLHLRNLLKGDVPRIPNAVLGEVMHMGRDPFSNIITLNRGSRDQIRPGQAVVDEQGVVGQITRVYPYTSEVTLITDKKLSIPIQIERNQLRAIAFGEGKRNTLDIPYLPTSVDIKVGDKLVTSGIDGVYPAGLAVAQVTHIKQSQDSPFAKIISRPIAGVNNHKHVLILALPESAPSVSVMETRPAMPRNSAQQLDQAVVDVLQQANAKTDPIPPSKATPTEGIDPPSETPPPEVDSTNAPASDNPPQASPSERTPPTNGRIPSTNTEAATPAISNPTTMAPVTSQGNPHPARGVANAVSASGVANVAVPRSTPTHHPVDLVRPALATPINTPNNQLVRQSVVTTQRVMVNPGRLSNVSDARGRQGQ